MYFRAIFKTLITTNNSTKHKLKRECHTNHEERQVRIGRWGSSPNTGKTSPEWRGPSLAAKGNSAWMAEETAHTFTWKREKASFQQAPGFAFHYSKILIVIVAERRIKKDKEQKENFPLLFVSEFFLFFCYSTFIVSIFFFFSIPDPESSPNPTPPSQALQTGRCTADTS